jgi:hypothetical protein
MSKRWLTLWLVGLLGPPAFAAGQDPPKPPPAAKAAEPLKSFAEQIAAIKKEHQERQKAFYDELRAARNDAQRVRRANDEFHKFVREKAVTLRTLIKEHAADPAAFEGILVLVGQMHHGLDDELLGLVLKHHLADPRMGQLCFYEMHSGHDPMSEKLLREVAAKQPDRAIRGQAMYALGTYLRYQAMPLYGKVSEADEGKYLAEAERNFTEVVKSHAEVKTPDGRARLGDKAASELSRIKNLPNLKVGKAAPEIAGEDIDGVKFKLSDYRGKVVVLDFWGHW